jgi:molecular chaperone HtpG
VWISDRLPDSAVCLVAAEHGPTSTSSACSPASGASPLLAKTILEVNPRHQLIVARAGLSADTRAFTDDAVHLLFEASARPNEFYIGQKLS